LHFKSDLEPESAQEFLKLAITDFVEQASSTSCCAIYRWVLNRQAHMAYYWYIVKYLVSFLRYYHLCFKKKWFTRP